MDDNALKRAIGEAMAKAFAAASESNEDGEPTANGLPEAQVMTLKEHFEVYAAKPTLKIGDVVTPKKGVNQLFYGEPMVVLEVLDEPIKTELLDHSAKSFHTPGFGNRLNIRAMLLVKGQATALWYEHWQLEPYIG